MKLLKVVLVIAVIVGLSGCATLMGKFGIATETYVDEQVAASKTELQADIQADLDENRSRIDSNQATIDKYAETAGELESLMESFRQAVQTTDELMQLADVLEQRLENLPVETIRQLVGILESYLEGK